ncbi:hypothetical protein HBJ58_22415 [Halomonas desiderata]|uniref:hypothetical protein n=1 Tax=Billgrantia desiderata TaxID=52021 RepID=UPI0017481A0A|nr:hypothetical protein [Halomonas desiderata]
MDRAVTLQEVIDENLRTVTYNVERRELYRWLRAQGIPEESIPPAIRIGLEAPNNIQPIPQKSASLNPKRKNTYLRFINGLVLDVLGGDIPDEPYKAAAILQGILEKNGFTMKQDTIVSVLKEIKEL